MLSAVLADCVNRIVIGDLKRNKPELIIAIETPSLIPLSLDGSKRIYRLFSRTSSFVVMVQKGSELRSHQADHSQASWRKTPRR
jgi:hypothetical protein